MNWKIAYLGTYHPAVETLSALVKRGWVNILIVPEEAGCKNDEILRIAKQYGLPWSYNLSDLETADINLVLAANYPKLIPRHILDQYPCINTHWSALPKYRGVHGTAWALLNGDTRIACSVHLMGMEFDVGDVLAQEYVEITPDMDIEDLHCELAVVQAAAVIRLLTEYDPAVGWQGRPQDESAATYVPQRMPEDGIIDWRWPTERIWNLVRALPRPKYPGAFTFIENHKLIIWKARPAMCPPYFCTPGQVVRVRKGAGVWVKTGDTCLEVLEVEIEGDANGPLPAEQVLKRGRKLGYDPQREIAALRGEVAALRAALAAQPPENG